MEKSVELQKLLKKGKGTLITGLIMIIGSIAVVIFAYLSLQDIIKNPVLLNEATKENEYAKVDVNVMTDYFAVNEINEKDNKVYLVFDGENRLYMVNLNSEARSELNDIYDYSFDEDKEFPGAVTIYGTTVKIPSSLQTLAINFYNEWMDEEFLTDHNFNDYLGFYYLDTNQKSDSEENMIYAYMVGGLFGIIGICLIGSFFKNKKESKKSLEIFEGNLEKLEEEINRTSTMNYQKYKLFITDNYIVSYLNCLQVVLYKDIVWLYAKEITYRGSTTRTIYVVTKDSKIHTVCNVGVSKKTKADLEEIYQALLLKLPKKALDGYTNENRLKVKELYVKK